MADIIPTVQIDISKELSNLSLLKYNPNGVLDAALNRVSDMVGGKVKIVDPSNPFMYMLETSCLNTAFAIQEWALLTRKQYPRLATTEEDLYLHMSDKDYLGRFSSPSKTQVIFSILFNDLMAKGYKDPATGDILYTLPKHYKVTISNLVFTLTAPIVVLVTPTGVVDVRYMVEQQDDIHALSTGYLTFTKFKLNQEEEYVQFKAEMPELDIEATDIPVEKSKLFKGELEFSAGRKFYHAKAYHMLNGEWVEMLTTHTEQVYDINTVTCILKVNQTNNTVGYYIPPTYINNAGRMGSKVKFVIYTTMGEVSINFGDYKVSDFSSEYNPVFAETDLNLTTDALRLITKVNHIEGKLEGGKGPKTFAQLKSDVIQNNLGSNSLPITNVQVESFLDNAQFKLVRDVDVVTNRQFLLEANIPASPSRYSVSKLNLDIVEYATSVTDLRTDRNSIVAVSPSTTLIPAGTLFEITSNGLNLLTKDEYDQLKQLSGNSLVRELNAKRYGAVLYHYVLDVTESEVDLRAYDLQKPKVTSVNFVNFNDTCRVGINTSMSNLIKTDAGFTLDVMGVFTAYDPQYTPTNLNPYIVYSEENGSTFYLEGRLFTVINNQPVYRFYIDTQYNVDSLNRIEINNFKDTNGNYISIFVDLEVELNLIYTINRISSQFEASSMDNYIYGSYIAVGNAVVTLEKLNTKFGDTLTYLYKRVHSSTGLNEYMAYDEDVYAIHDKTVYAADNTVLHHRGEPQLDDDGEPILKHRKGEVVLDEYYNPSPISRRDVVRYLNLLLIDYKANVSNDQYTIELRDYVREYLTNLITVNVPDVQGRLLENTVAYLTVPATLNNVLVKYDGRSGYINSAQDFEVNVYLGKAQYEDNILRDGVSNIIRTELEAYLGSNQTLSKSVIVSQLLAKVAEFVKGVSFKKFTELNAEYIELPDEGSRISYNKVLSFEHAGYRLSEALVFNFIQVS